MAQWTAPASVTGVFLRSPPPNTSDTTPSPYPSSQPNITTFRHPGYPDAWNVMFRLPAIDRATPLDEQQLQPQSCQWGIHHATALRFCSILSCNAEGFLTTARIPVSPLAQHGDLVNCNSNPATVLAPLEGLLVAPSYYYYPNEWSPQDLPYPVCPDFSNWEFPHGQLPDDWTVAYSRPNTLSRPIPAPSQYSLAVAIRDVSCRISNFTDCLQTAHLIPKGEVDWFQRNVMETYNINPALPCQYLTCDISNCISIRQDLHTVFDRQSFVLVPKRGSSTIHFLITSPNYAPLFHNCITEQLNIAPEFLYARLAWAILPLIGSFARRKGVRIKVWDSATSAWKEMARSDEIAEAIVPTPTTKRRRGVDTTMPPVERTDNDDDIDSYSKRAKTTTAINDSSFSSTDSPQRHSRRMQIFSKIVEKNPDYAWDNLPWHPDVEKFEKLKEIYLAEREPDLHRQEIARQTILLQDHMSQDEEVELPRE